MSANRDKAGASGSAHRQCLIFYIDGQIRLDIYEESRQIMQTWEQCRKVEINYISIEQEILDKFSKLPSDPKKEVVINDLHQIDTDNDDQTIHIGAVGDLLSTSNLETNLISNLDTDLIIEMQSIIDQEWLIDHQENHEKMKIEKNRNQDEDTKIDDIDIQQKLYLSLKESHKKKELEIDNIVGRTRTLTAEEEQQENKAKMELLEAVDEQKTYIKQLEAENQQLMSNKIKRDDDMFMELKQLRPHRFAGSMQMDALSNLAPSEYESHHSRGGSQSFSNYSNSGFAYFHTTPPSNAGNPLTAIMTRMNLFGMDDMNDDEDNTQLINYSIKEEETKTEVDIDSDVNDIDKLGRRPKEKMEEMFKVNAEIEFFLMTCLAVKQNLCEEYPDKPEVMTENAMALFEGAQKEHVVMSKFNLWIEVALREKYDLPKLEGFKKFMDKHGIAEKFDKTKQKSKKLAKKTGKLISAKTEEFAGRIRGLSKGGYNSENEDDKNKDDYKDGDYKQEETLAETKDETNGDGTGKDIVINMKGTDTKDKTKQKSKQLATKKWGINICRFA